MAKEVMKNVIDDLAEEEEMAIEDTLTKNRFLTRGDPAPSKFARNEVIDPQKSSN